MVDLLKAFGRGVLYIILFPFFLVILAIFAVIGLLAFVFQLFKSIFFFFTGQKFFPELPEDKELRLKLEAEEALKNPQPAPQTQPVMGGYAQPQPQPMMNNYQQPQAPAAQPQPAYQEAPYVNVTREQPAAPTNTTTVEEACFGVEEEPVAPAPEVIKEPEPVKEKITLMREDKNDVNTLEDFVNPMEKERIEAEEEILEVYKPKGSEDDFYEDDEDNTIPGIKIKFDD